MAGLPPERAVRVNAFGEKLCIEGNLSSEATRVDIASQRLRNQHLTRPRRGSPADLVASLGAVQAQEYPFAKWALALRLAAKSIDADIDAAVTRGAILRTHV